MVPTVQHVDGCNARDTGKLLTWAREEGYSVWREALACIDNALVDRIC